MVKRQPNPFFKFQQFTIFHDKCAMKVGTDGVLLGTWVSINNAKLALDIGTGTGLIALMIVQRGNNLIINIIDINSDATLQAIENVSRSPFANRIDVQQIAIQDYSTDKKYDLIVSNPPYFNQSFKSPDSQRTTARHTDSLTAEDLIKYSKNLLSENGQLSLIYPFEYKETLISLAKENQLYPTRITNVYPTPQSKPKRILIELSQKEAPLIENNLIIELERHVYSDEFKELVKDFYLKKD